MFCPDIYISVIKEVFGYPHCGFGFFDSSFNLFIFIEFDGNEGAQVFELVGELHELVVREDKVGGNVPSALRRFASFKELGKNMASVFDFMLFPPRCICIPNRLKCWLRMGVSVSNSLRLSVMNTLSSTKKTLLS